MSIKNYGFIDEPIQDTDYILGAEKLPKINLQKDGQWGDFLPNFEAQRIKIETMACVSFSALNCLETLHNRFYGLLINKSDRFTAKCSGTTPRGNSMRSVAESIRKDGTVKESIYPYENITSWSQYYKTIPNSIIQKGQDWLKKYSVGYEWVYDSGLSIAQKQDRLIEALQYSPIQVALASGSKQKGGIYQDSGMRPDHATVIYGYKKDIYWKVLDTYKNEFKKFAWNYNFKYAMRFNLTKTKKSMEVELYKDDNHHITRTVYIKGGKLGDNLYHPIFSDKFTKALFGDWKTVLPVPLNRILDKNEIGDTFGTIPSVLVAITNIFKK